MLIQSKTWRRKYGERSDSLAPGNKNQVKETANRELILQCGVCTRTGGDTWPDLNARACVCSCMCNVYTMLCMVVHSMNMELAGLTGWSRCHADRTAANKPSTYILAIRHPHDLRVDRFTYHQASFTSRVISPFIISCLLSFVGRLDILHACSTISSLLRCLLTRFFFFYFSLVISWRYLFNINYKNISAIC